MEIMSTFGTVEKAVDSDTYYGGHVLIKTFWENIHTKIKENQNLYIHILTLGYFC